MGSTGSYRLVLDNYSSILVEFYKASSSLLAPLFDLTTTPLQRHLLNNSPEQHPNGANDDVSNTAYSAACTTKDTNASSSSSRIVGNSQSCFVCIMICRLPFSFLTISTSLHLYPLKEACLHNLYSIADTLIASS